MLTLQGCMIPFKPNPTGSFEKSQYFRDPDVGNGEHLKSVQKDLVPFRSTQS